MMITASALMAGVVPCRTRPASTVVRVLSARIAKVVAAARVSLAVAAVGVEFAFDVGSGLMRPLGDFLRPLAHPEDDLRWLLVLSWGVLASILAVPLALGGHAVGRWLPLGCALIGLRAGMHAGELSTLLVWDFTASERGASTI